MANIIAKTNYRFYDGMSITFKAPCDCSVVQGLTVMDPTSEKSFVFKDALGNTLTGFENIFSEGAYVKAILDTTNHYAYLQNAETPGYGILKENTKPLYGFDETATPDDLFKKIGLGGMNYIPTTVVDTPIFDKWELYPHLPIDPEKAAVRDFQYLEDAYYMLTQNTAKSPYSFILWRSEDLVNWTQGATIHSPTNAYYVQNSWRNRIFRANGRFLAVIQDRSYYDGSGYTRVFYSDAYDDTFSAASISGRTRCKCPNFVNGLLFFYSELTTTPALWVYDVATNKYSSKSFNGTSTANAFGVLYRNGKYYMTYQGVGNYNVGKTIAVTVTNTTDAVSITLDTANQLDWGGEFVPYGDDVYMWCLHSTSRYFYKLNFDTVSASSRIKECASNSSLYYRTVRDGKPWLALSADPDGQSRGRGYYTPSGEDFSSFDFVRAVDSTWASSITTAWDTDDSSDPWVINEDERIISFDMQTTETTYKVIPKIVDYFGNDILLPGNQLSGGLQLAVGSYEGAGTYGSSNRNTLTFDFTPMLVAIFTSAGAQAIMLGGLGKAKALASTSYYTASSNVTGTSSYANWTVTWDDNAVSWYAEYAANHQFNSSGSTYSYIAIGI